MVRKSRLKSKKSSKSPPAAGPRRATESSKVMFFLRIGTQIVHFNPASPAEKSWRFLRITESKRVLQLGGSGKTGISY